MPKHGNDQITHGTNPRGRGNYNKNSISSGSSLSTLALQAIVEKLKLQRVRDSTKKNYYGVWKLFNDFFIQLDEKPNNWEDR